MKTFLTKILLLAAIVLSPVAATAQNVIAILSQSQGSNLRDVSYPVTPLPNTFMWDGTQWVAPVNNVATFCNEFITITGSECRVVVGSVGGSRIVNPAFDANGNSLWWREQINATSPLRKFQAAVASLPAGSVVRVGLWPGEESDAGDGVTTAQYTQAAIQLQAIFGFPLIISPVGHADAMLPYGNGRNVLASVYQLNRNSGFTLGPEYYDLPTDNTGIHLTGDGYAEFATRLADAAAAFFGFTVNPSRVIWSANPTVDSTGWAGWQARAIALGMSGAASQIRVTFQASSQGFAADHISAAVQGNATLPNLAGALVPLRVGGVLAVSQNAGVVFKTNWTNFTAAVNDNIGVEIGFTGGGPVQSGTVSNAREFYKNGGSIYTDAGGVAIIKQIEAR